ncbi:unnamed protein product [Phytophthora lilii]|uniref:Unnamed protein product n=1 Tax=Phytophthora lilii TaxID=2077276 RepID=A0A9W6XCW4_9STRA|nr:unnamed protein product [Phytophthora lilii]GMF39176.1 unnamed protein product [Phytophthora lilii]
MPGSKYHRIAGVPVVKSSPTEMSVRSADAGLVGLPKSTEGWSNESIPRLQELEHPSTAIQQQPVQFHSCIPSNERDHERNHENGEEWLKVDGR